MNIHPKMILRETIICPLVVQTAETRVDEDVKAFDGRILRGNTGWRLRAQEIGERINDEGTVRHITIINVYLTFII